VTEITIPYVERFPKIRMVTSFGKAETDHEAHRTFGKWHSWLLNVWIPSQPDRDDLRNLFIEVAWDTRKWLHAVETACLPPLDEERVRASHLRDLP